MIRYIRVCIKKDSTNSYEAVYGWDIITLKGAGTERSADMIKMPKFMQFDLVNVNEENRKKWIKKQLQNLPKGSSILDAGAGQLRWKETCSHLKYTSQDFCQYDGLGNGEGIQNQKFDTSKIDIVSDIIDIPVKDGIYDAILCTEVLEHLAYPEMAIKEFSRILCGGGVLILTAPFCSLTHMAPYHFCTGFNKYWYEKHLEEYGFEIEIIESNGDYFSYMQQELKRLPGVIRTYTGKRSYITSLIALILYKLCGKVCTKNNKSDELLCFGYHIRARKVG